MARQPDKKMVERVRKLRARKLSYREISKLLNKDLHSVWRWGHAPLIPVKRDSQAYRERNPEKVQARKKVYHALRAGRISRKPCEVCVEPKSEAHHDDYAKPLDVRWLCKEHHAGAKPVGK